MRTCSICGNEIPDRTRVCPFCERPQTPAPASHRGTGGVPTVNVKAGMPTVAAALTHLTRELQAQRRIGAKVVRVVHGWGSTGQGGAIRHAVRSQLGTLRGRGGIRAFVPGEDYSEFVVAGQSLLRRHPGLRSTLQSDRLNPGVTLVEL